MTNFELYVIMSADVLKIRERGNKKERGLICAGI